MKKERRGGCIFVLCIWIMIQVLNLFNVWEVDDFERGLVAATLFWGGAIFLYFVCIREEK